MKKLMAMTVLGLALTACPKKTPDPAMGGEGPGAPAMTSPIADNMAEAPKHALGTTHEVALPCNGAGYMVVDVAEGQDFTVEVKTPEGCAMVYIMKDNGSTNDMPNHETCADAPKGPLAGKGQAVRTLVSVTETGACKGVMATVELK